MTHKKRHRKGERTRWSALECAYIQPAFYSERSLSLHVQWSSTSTLGTRDSLRPPPPKKKVSLLVFRLFLFCSLYIPLPLLPLCFPKKEKHTRESKGRDIRRNREKKREFQTPVAFNEQFSTSRPGTCFPFGLR